MCAAVDTPLAGRTPLASRAARPAQVTAGFETPEGAAAERFMVACLAARHDPQKLVALCRLAPVTDTGWQDVAALARQEWLAPLLYRIVHGRDLVPTAIELAWRDVYYESLRLSAFWHHELETLVTALAGAGVPVILLKGAALGETVYGNPALRPMTDLDLLVRQADVPAALATLRRAGYTTDEPFGHFAEVEARKPGAPPCLVDLHWTLVGIPHYQEAIPDDWVWQTAHPAAVGKATARVLGLEAQLLHLCAHLVVQHRDGGRHLLWLYDVAEFLYHYESELDWPALLAAAARFDLVLPLQQVLPRVAEAYAPPVPPAALTALAGLQPSRQELRIHRSFGAATWSPSQIGWLGLSTLPGWRSRLAYLGANLFPSPAYMRWRYHVRRPALIPFYYARRWVEGLGGILGLLPALMKRTPMR